jgi:SagB-type dehydrogenase family enzyme
MFGMGVRIIVALVLTLSTWSVTMAQTNIIEIDLPAPRKESQFSLEAALSQRRSVRSYASDPLDLANISQLLWATQGLNRPGGYRSVPSAGALYPLEAYLVVGNVDGLPAGVYRYRPLSHDLRKTVDGDRRDELTDAALGQGSIRRAPAVLVLCAVFERTTEKYGQRGIQYTYMEAGHAAQNFALQAVALGLGSVPIGAFRDNRVKKALALPDNEHPLYIIPVGKPRD